MSIQRQMDRLTVKRFETLQLLISVEFGRHFPGNVPSELLQSLLQTTLALLQPSELDCYLSRDDPSPVEPVTLSTTSTLTSTSSSPPPPSRNLAGFGQRLSNFVSSLSGPTRDYRYTFTEVSSDITTLRRHFPLGCNLHCSHCGSAAHFGQDCPTYSCPTCMVSAPGHARHNCPTQDDSPGSSSSDDSGYLDF